MLGLDLDALSVVDFEGQKLAEWLMIRIVIIFATAGFFAGYALSNWHLMVYINAAGLAITCLAVLPPWPWYRRHPLAWLPPLNPANESQKKK